MTKFNRIVGVSVAAILLAVTFVGSASPAQAANGDAILRSGGQMLGGNFGTSFLSSPGGEHQFFLQNDCNFVDYTGDGRATWATDTYNYRGNYCAVVMQTDGNLVLYYNSVNSYCCWRALWNSETNGNPGAYFLVQWDGNSVVYASNGRALWSTWYGRTY